MGLKTKTKKLIFHLLNRSQEEKDFARWQELYGEFDQGSYGEFTITDLPSESGLYHGEIIKWARDLHPQAILFAGENTKTAPILQKLMGAESVYTCGLGDTNFQWNFEQDPPALDIPFDLLISQAILEHLLNPYRHLEDLSGLLQEGGHLILHTVLPGFAYHRHPIDALRFYPDWFEETGRRVGLEAVKKRIVGTHIFYMYKKTNRS